MAGIQIDLPEKFNFSTQIPIRITDLNYGGHVGNDTVLTLLHEARVQFLKNYGYEELNFEGVSLIMSDAAIKFKSELFYGEIVTAFVTAANLSRVGFEVCYKLMKGEVVVAVAKTVMVCYNYDTKKVVSLPEKAKEKLLA